jgi:hypothetical protein
MITPEEILKEIGSISSLDTPAKVGAAIGLLEQLTTFIPEPAGRMASIGLLIARDQALAGKSSEDLEALRHSIRAEWQAEIDRQFPNG